MIQSAKVHYYILVMEFNQNTQCGELQNLKYYYLTNLKNFIRKECQYQDYLQKHLKIGFFLSQILEQTVNKKYSKYPSDTQKKQASEQNYFKLKGSYDQNNLRILEFDQTLYNQLKLEFESSNPLRLLFGCDRARDIYKFSLLKSIDVKRFQIKIVK
ncbi:unnamed protein product [Paramecium primaurelia]|uniref:Uncharacterized protein n=1 Tax=Paramecium primaurelia TaxID=5886 RepID=A0A8S1MEM9_PARPR|nr:unnamed protein product [Paramecium primaurelia]